MYLCSKEKYHQNLYRHLIKFHKLKPSIIRIIRQAITNNDDPFKKNLFQSNEIVIDTTRHFQCPFSIYNNESSNMNRSFERHCRTIKPQFAHSLRYHLMNYHSITLFIK